MRQDVPPPPPPYKKPVTPERPPLGGTNSLREALAMVTGKKDEKHTPDLKETLGNIIGQGGPKPGLSEKALRDMLVVNDIPDGNA